MGITKLGICPSKRRYHRAVDKVNVGGKFQNLLVSGISGGNITTLPLDVVGMRGEVFEDPSPLFSEAADSDLLGSFPLLLDPQNRAIAGC